MSLDGGDLIRICRKKAGLSQRELARRVGISCAGLWRYETGRDMPRWDKVVWCLNVCGYTFEIKEIQDGQSDNNTDGSVGSADVRLDSSNGNTE